jgi:hypothetical protein
MRRKSWWVGLVLLLAASAAGAQTLEEILGRHVEARGGAAKLAAVESLRIRGRFFGPGGEEMPFLYEWRRPDRFRFELTEAGLVDIQAFDGTEGWRINPPGQLEAAPMAAVELAMMNDAMDFEGRLIGAQAKGVKLELIGKAEVEGTPAWEIEVTRADGGIERSFLDAEHYLEILQVERYQTPSGPMELEVTWGDYREMGGALFPGSWSRKPKGAPAGINILFEQVEVNPELPESRFARPKEAGR